MIKLYSSVNASKDEKLLPTNYKRVSGGSRGLARRSDWSRCGPRIHCAEEEPLSCLSTSGLLKTSWSSGDGHRSLRPNCICVLARSRFCAAEAIGPKRWTDALFWFRPSASRCFAFASRRGWSVFSFPGPYQAFCRYHGCRGVRRRRCSVSRFRSDVCGRSEINFSLARGGYLRECT